MFKPVAIPWLSVLVALLCLCGSIRPLPAACLAVTGTAMQEAAKPSHEREEAGTVQDREEDRAVQDRERLAADYAEKANRVIDHYVRAQQAFFAEDYRQALQEIDSALMLTGAADLVAFKGAIYYGMGQYAEAAREFSRAFSLDKELPVPRVQGLRIWLTDNDLLRDKP